MFLEVDEDFIEHPKAVRLCRLLMNPLGWAYVIKLWRWCTKYQRDGLLSGYEVGEIEFALGWTLDEGKLVAALVKAGFIDETKEGLRVHDWDKHQGKWIRKFEAERQRSRERREGRRQADRDDAPVSLHELAETEKQAELPVEPSINRGATAVRPQRDRDSSALLSNAEQSKEGGDPPARDPSAPATELTAHGLLDSLRIQAELRRPELGFWNPGRFAERDARDFVERIPVDKRAAFLAEVPGKIRAFFEESDDWVRKAGWPFKAFVDRYSGLGLGRSGKPKKTVVEILADEKAERERARREDAELDRRHREMKAEINAAMGLT